MNTIENNRVCYSFIVINADFTLLRNINAPVNKKTLNEEKIGSEAAVAQMKR